MVRQLPGCLNGRQKRRDEMRAEIIKLGLTNASQLIPFSALPSENHFDRNQFNNPFKRRHYPNINGTLRTPFKFDTQANIIVRPHKVPKKTTLIRSFLLLNTRHLTSTVYYLLLFTFLLSIKFYEIDCLSKQDNFQHHRKHCELDKDFLYEIVEPMVVIESSKLGESKKSGGNFNTTDPLQRRGSLSTIRSLSSFVSCPNTLKIQFSGYGETFVIDLVKNKRLISDRYFEISKDSTNRHGRHPDASSKDSSHLDDGEFYKNHMFLNLHNFTTNNDHCHYHGIVDNDPESISAISIVEHKLLSGFFHTTNDVYYLYANTTNSSTILTKSTDLCNSKQDNLVKMIELKSFIRESNASGLNQKDHTYDGSIRHRSPQLAQSSRKNRRFSSSSSENYIRHGPFKSNSSSLYVELLIVHDHSQFREYEGNTSNIAERTMQIVNIMNTFYRQLNIFVALVGVVLWTEKDEIQLTEDGDSTLTNFLKYRYDKLLSRYDHDNAQLITSTSFNGSVVGKALKGPICTHEHSGGVNTDHSHSPAIVAVTLAHELGHNFGMEHDEEDKCKCPDEKCIMSSSSSTVHPKHWSSCSIEYLEDSRKHGLLECLSNEPTKVFGPICGNGFVEDGEDCDLGEPIPLYGTSKSRKAAAAARCARNGQDCDLNTIPPINPCCDRHTCKFVANATCAQGPCCDLTRCSVYNGTETKICRHRQSECDLEEVCDGKSEYCPPDVYYHDGIECGPTLSSDGKQPSVDSASYNRSRAYCYNGKCASHESQCLLLWGPTGTVSQEICFDQNVHGNTSGNCGYDRKEKSYKPCEPEDAICGMLHCVHNQPGVGESRTKTGKLGYGFESASILTLSFFALSNQTKIYCDGAIIDAGPNIRDPGLVPNGAACGDDRMCLNQKCVPVYEVFYKNWCPSDCNGNGICDNMGVCHCNDGTIGTSCYQFFGSNFHLSLLLYMVMFFVPMIGLIVLVINHYKKQLKLWWFLHNRKIVLRDRAREQPHRRMPYDLSRNNITISDPIPLNQQNNINRPFYQPPADPWTETSASETNNTTTANSKPPGYRLPPANLPFFVDP